METNQAGAVAGELTAEFAAAWNQHEMQALASLFHEDAAFVNVAGAYCVTRLDACTRPPFGAVLEREPRALWPRHDGCSAGVRRQ